MHTVRLLKLSYGQLIDIHRKEDLFIEGKVELPKDYNLC
jgi:hypothetical protein